ncbi:MAG: CRISPR-associated endonuclease Cas1 [Xanthomonadales bacterium]|jgi:CRISPR-associated protein Cas1|nr:CRISPR-associated endonuclease Cas1 [Xanthomonadales bacterium]
MTGYVIVIDHKQRSIDGDAYRLLIREEGRLFRGIAWSQLALLIIGPQTEVVTRVWSRLAAHGIAALLLARDVEHSCWITPAHPGWSQNRADQYRARESRGSRLALARFVLREKCLAYRAASGSLMDGALESAIERVLRALDDASDEDSLRGLEGGLAAEWFRHLRAGLDPGWGFRYRQRRPPPDPFNAVLSLGYTILAATAARALLRNGLDPAVGFLHSPQSDRDALALDALECLRPRFDRHALRLMQGWSIADFIGDPQLGCRLGKSARLGFYSAMGSFQDEMETELRLWCQRFRSEMSKARFEHCPT